MKKRVLFLVLVFGVGISLILIILFKRYSASGNRTKMVLAYLRNPKNYQDLVIPAMFCCNDAPFHLPTSGMIGFLWDDSFRLGHRHQGIDIFGGGEVGETPVYAAYDGYLTRLEEWKSSVILRIPVDPLQPDRQIWLYYTHMADQNGTSLIQESFPPGTEEVFVSEGTLLGYQGNYSGTPGNPTGVHLHFSIVKDDGQGKYLNELDIRNTLDPSPYFNLPLNANKNPLDIPQCEGYSP